MSSPATLDSHRHSRTCFFFFNEKPSLKGFSSTRPRHNCDQSSPSDPNDTWAHDINFLLDEKECAFPRLGEDNVEYFLGLTPSGIIVLRNKTKVGNYYWPRISKIYFKGRYFMLRVCDKNLYDQDGDYRKPAVVFIDTPGWHYSLGQCISLND
uniref:FERM C-terminal PH-like domain-containing protein n=1 Tax=Timema poppense TaxID=170557 RepID=A0A7R9CNV6_TIMPO|nr:unnamed protein product [Timema poppensis]